MYIRLAPAERSDCPIAFANINGGTDYYDSSWIDELKVSIDGRAFLAFGMAGGFEAALASLIDHAFAPWDLLLTSTNGDYVHLHAYSGAPGQGELAQVRARLVAGRYAANVAAQSRRAEELVGGVVLSMIKADVQTAKGLASQDWVATAVQLAGGDRNTLELMAQSAASANFLKEPNPDLEIMCHWLGRQLRIALGLPRDEMAISQPSESPDHEVRVVGLALMVWNDLNRGCTVIDADDLHVFLELGGLDKRDAVRARGALQHLRLWCLTDDNGASFNELDLLGIVEDSLATWGTTTEAESEEWAWEDLLHPDEEAQYIHALADPASAKALESLSLHWLDHGCDGDPAGAVWSATGLRREPLAVAANTVTLASTYAPSDRCSQALAELADSLNAALVTLDGDVARPNPGPVTLPPS